MSIFLSKFEKASSSFLNFLISLLNQDDIKSLNSLPSPSKIDGIININMLRGSGGQLVVSVTDAGPGISPANIARAFEPFRQIDEGAARHHAGLGLGLFIARGIMRLHGGDVTLTSSPESGTDVRLVLPASRVDWAAARQKPALVAVANVA